LLSCFYYIKIKTEKNLGKNEKYGLTKAGKWYTMFFIL